MNRIYMIHLYGITILLPIVIVVFIEEVTKTVNIAICMNTQIIINCLDL